MPALVDQFHYFEVLGISEICGGTFFGGPFADKVAIADGDLADMVAQGSDFGFEIGTEYLPMC
jgi:hypothetical protein